MGIALIIIGVLLLVFFMLSGRLILPLREKFDALTRGGSLIEASVLDTHTEEINTSSGKRKIPVLIAQFRIEEQKKTVIHRCTEKFYGKYSRGDKVSLIFREEMPVDFAIISGDNRYEHMIMLITRLRMPAAVSGAFLMISGILLTVL